MLFRQLPSVQKIEKLKIGVSRLSSLNRLYRQLNNQKSTGSDYLAEADNYKTDLNFTVQSVLESVPKYKPRSNKAVCDFNSYIADQGQSCKIGAWILGEQNKYCGKSAEEFASELTETFFKKLQETQNQLLKVQEAPPT